MQVGLIMVGIQICVMVSLEIIQIKPKCVIYSIMFKIPFMHIVGSRQILPYLRPTL